MMLKFNPLDCSFSDCRAHNAQQGSSNPQWPVALCRCDGGLRSKRLRPSCLRLDSGVVWSRAVLPHAC